MTTIYIRAGRYKSVERLRLARALVIGMVMLSVGLFSGVALASPTAPNPFVVITLFYVGDDVLCDQNWATAACWSLTSGGAGGAGPPSSANDVTFDSNSGAFSAVSVTSPATAQDVRWDTSSVGGATEIDIFSTLTVRSVFSDRTNGPSTILIDVSPAQVRFTGTIAGNTLGTISIGPMDSAGIVTYNGLNATASSSYTGFERIDASGGPTIYCSPGCIDNGGNVNIVFGPPPVSNPSIACKLNSAIPGVELTTLFILFIGVGIFLAILSYLGFFGGYAVSGGIAMAQFDPKSWMVAIVSIVIIVIVVTLVVQSISC